MNRTSPVVLVILAVVGGALGYTVNQLLTNSGRATFAPSGFLPVLLLVLAAASLALAWPVRRSTRHEGRGRIDPFRALRAVTLARSSSLLGALMGGFGAGLLAFAVSRPVAPAVGSVVTILALVVSAVVLVAAALVAEQFCTLPKDPDDGQLDSPDANARP